MIAVALVALVSVAYFCGMVDVSHRDRTPYGLVVVLLVAAALYHQFGEIL
jgi:Flp pilus assembly protein protease CpaA